MKIEKAIEIQQKLIKEWENRAKELEEVIEKHPWEKMGYESADWRELELKRRKEQILTALITISALEKQIPKKTYFLNYGGHNVGNWNHGIACICDYKASYCIHCGQKLDWEVENE